MSDYFLYEDAVKTIKSAILQSQLASVQAVNENQLVLYYFIGKYISHNTRTKSWGQGAIEAIAKQLDKEMPGLRGFSARNLRYMRSFYEEWTMLDGGSNFALPSAKTEEGTDDPILHLQVQNYESFPMTAFLGIGFTLHRYIIEAVKDLEERLFYIKRCAEERYSVEELKRSLASDEYHHQGKMPNNFVSTISPGQRALKAICAFKDEYLLDYINTEEIDAREKKDIDEKVVEKGVIQDVKHYFLTFGKDFLFVGNQYHLDAFGDDEYIDLLFFNRKLNCLVAVELKTGKFKTSYLGQLSGYLSFLDEFEKRPHENPSIGIVLCKDMNRSVVDFVIRDYTKPMGVATYKTAKDMSQELLDALPDIEDLKRIINDDDAE